MSERVSDERLRYLAKWSIYRAIPYGVIVPEDSEPTADELADVLHELVRLRSILSQTKASPDAA